MMWIGHADFLVGPDAAFASNHHGSDPCNVGLKRDRLQVIHECGVIAEAGWDAGGLVEIRRGRGLTRLGDFDALFQVANRRHVFVEFVAIRRAPRAQQTPLLLAGDSEDALPIFGAAGARLRADARIEITEQALEQQPRIRFRREGRGWSAPRNAVRIGATVPGIAMADDATVIEPEFQRGEAGGVADLLRRAPEI